jgi:nitrous oxidase accessory protein NosD
LHPGDIDPRTRLQASVAKPASSTGISATIVRGQPGTGKTLSLLYAARGLAASQRVLYITYTQQLADDALLFSKTVGIGENLVVMTLSSLIASILSDPPDAKIENPDAIARGFEGMIRGLDSSVVGAWATKGVALWAEARASLVGMALPFAWKRGHLTIPACELIDLPLYCEISGLDREPAEKARHLADLARKRGLLSDQTRARAALDMLIKGSAGRLLMEGVQSVMLDEAQDLTPVEFALLLEMTRHVGKSHAAVHFLAAGDESQTVHPSGFEWGIAKDLIRERLGREPKDIGLGQMMRNPGVIHTIIKNTSSLYKNLPKSFRPSGGMADDSPPVQDVGQVFRCLLPKGGREALLDTLVALPGRALVQLEKAAYDMRQPTAAKTSGPTTNDPWASVTFTPAEIKGLERRIVVVTGLGETLGSIQRLTQCEVHERRSLESLEARYLIDGVRVALSRATDTLIVVEQDATPTASPALTKDLMAHAESIQWDELLVLLEKDDLSDEERAYVFLAEAREFAQRDDAGRALERLKRAEAVAGGVTDETLSGMLRELRQQIEKKAGLRIVVAPSGGDFDSLQEAIDTAPEGATLYVRPGTYTGPFLIEKNLKMLADGPQETVILDGDVAVVLVKNSHVTLDGLTIVRRPIKETTQSSGGLFKQMGRWAAKTLGLDKTTAIMKELGALTPYDKEKLCVGVGIVNGKLDIHGCSVHGEGGYGIMTSTSQAQVTDCSLQYGKAGLLLGPKCTVTVERTVVSNADHGIDALGTVRLVVRDSSVRDIKDDGIWLGDGAEALIENNTLHANRFGLAVHVGVEAMVRKNRFQRCYGGIKLHVGAGGIYEDNDILESKHVGFWGTTDCDPMVRGNRIRNGDQYGIFLDAKTRGRYEENQIIGNADTGFMLCGENQVIVRNSLIQGNAKTHPSVFVGEGTVGIFESNEISNTQGNGVALTVDAGEGFVVRKNRIHHHPRQGLSIRGKGCLFEENEIYEVLNVGVIVESGGRAIMLRNNIHHNGFGIIIHEGSSGVFEYN